MIDEPRAGGRCHDYSGIIAGVDEVGRGPLAGPVLAAAVVLDASRPIEGITDSKRLSPLRRETLTGSIRRHAMAWCVAEASVSEIDELNILQATLLAMCRAIDGLGITVDLVLVDGNRCPQIEPPVRSVVGGDTLIPEIGAASIIAKVTRDALMTSMDRDYPGYGFARNKGYPTQEHLQALQALGPSPAHRRSFAPVRAVSGAMASRRSPA